MFKIIKKGSGNFWHNFNNGSKEVNLSDWEIVLDSVNQTVSLQMLNGANVPNNSVIISDVVVIDETDSSVEETFVSVSALRTRLIELNYTPYIVLNGFVPEAPIDGLTYGRKDAEWVEVSGGGSVGTLQQVTDNGNTTTKDIILVDNSNNKLIELKSEFQGFQTSSILSFFTSLSSFAKLRIRGNGDITTNNFNLYNGDDVDNNIGVTNVNTNSVGTNNVSFPDASGTIALVSDISTPTLQQVTDNGNTIVSGDFQANFEASAIEVTNQLTGTGTSIDATEGVVIKTGSFQGKIKTDNLTAVRTNQLPDTSGTIALTSDIPTVDTTPTDGSSNAVSSNGVFDGLALKQDALTETNFGSFINARTAKNTLVDADEVVSDDSADSNKAKKTTWLNVWTNYLKPKADALYQYILTDVPIKSIIADYTTSSGVTGTTSETLISSYKINANTLSALDFMNMTLRLLKTGATSGYSITIRIGTTSTFSTSLTQIATYGWTIPGALDVNIQRYFKIEGGFLKGSNFTFAMLNNQGAVVVYSESTVAFNTTVDNWIFISVKPQTNNADVITQSIFKITN